MGKKGQRKRGKADQTTGKRKLKRKGKSEANYIIGKHRNEYEEYIVKRGVCKSNNASKTWKNDGNILRAGRSKRNETTETEE